MDSWIGLLWSVITWPSSTTALPVVKVALLLVFVFCWDYPLLLVWRLCQRILGFDRFRRDQRAELLPVLVVIPSLLRRRDELTSMKCTVASIAENGYAGDLTIVLSID